MPNGQWRSLDEHLESTGQFTPIQDSERYVSYSLADLYPEWQENAHCAGVGHDQYFGNDAEQPTMSIAQVRRAAKLCDVCPVFVECLTHALTVREEYGVWAGTSGRARKRLFTMLDNGEYSIEQIIEVVLHDRAQRGVEPARPLRQPERGRGRVHDAAQGDVAL